MKRLFSILLLLTAIAICPSCRAQTLDAYGGRTDITCPNGAFTNYYLQKIATRWWICTPLGHPIYFQGVGVWTPPFNSSKYSSVPCTVAANITSEFQSWGFNGVGEDSTYSNLKLGNPCSSNPQMPEVDSIQVSLYSTAGPFSLANNFVGYATKPTKNMVQGNNDNSFRNTGGAANFRNAGLVDVFAPEYTTFVNGWGLNDPFFVAHRNDPRFMALMPDDTDYLAGLGGTPDFDTQPPGHTKPNLGYIVATTSPFLTYSAFTYPGGGTDGGGTKVFYSDAKVYTKSLMAPPPGTCSKATPCSYATYLQKLYGNNITNLNNAWGTGGFYTTFGSSGQCVGFTDALNCGSGSGSASETLGTGNGTSAVVNHTLTGASGSVSQSSVQLLLNGTDFGGDCPGKSVSASCQVNTITNGGIFPPVVSPGGWTSGTKTVGQQILDSNGYLETYTVGGASGGSQPSWSTTGGVGGGSFNALTTDGAATARNDGPILITGPTPFLQNNPCFGSGSGFPAASFWAQIIYHGTPPVGVSSAVSSRQVGNTCTAGKTVIVTGPDGATGSIANPTWATGYDVYASCRVSSGGATLGCAASGPNTPPPLTLQASNVPLAQISTIACAASVVTVTTVSAHGMSVGDHVDLFRTTGGFDSTQTNVAVSPTSGSTITYNLGGSCPSSSGSGGTIWKEFILPNAPMASGSALPAPPSTIDYTNKIINLTFSANLQTGVTIAANYVANGFGIGTGILDEDGRNTAWMGFEDVCLKPFVVGGGPGTTSYACRPGNGGGYAQPTMTAQVATDISAWQTQFASKYSSIIRAAMKQPGAEPNALLFGPDTIGDWFVPPRSEILAGFGGNLDGIFVIWNKDIPDQATAATIRSYLETAYGDHPIMNFSTIEANVDSDKVLSQPGDFWFYSQGARATAWYDMKNDVLNTTGANGTFQWVGDVWWASDDCSADNGVTNWGLKTCNDNAYDGSEAAAGVVACSPPLISLSCGNQPLVTVASWTPSIVNPTTVVDSNNNVESKVGGTNIPSGASNPPWTPWSPAARGTLTTENGVIWEMLGPKTNRPYGDVIGGAKGVKVTNGLWLAIAPVLIPAVTGSGTITGSGAIKNP